MANMLLSDSYVYTPATTDVTIRWRAMGWIPPSEQDEFRQKWATFRATAAKGIESIGDKELRIVIE